MPAPRQGARCSPSRPGRACPAPLPRSPPPSEPEPEPEPPPITPSAATELPQPSAPPNPGTHTSHPSPGQRPGNPSPCRDRPGPAAACPGARRPHSTSAGPTPQRPARRTAGRGKRPAQPMRWQEGGRAARRKCACASAVPAGKRSPGGQTPGQGRNSSRGQRRLLAVGGIYLRITIINVIIVRKRSALGTRSATCYRCKKRAPKTAGASAARSHRHRAGPVLPRLGNLPREHSERQKDNSVCCLCPGRAARDTL